MESQTKVNVRPADQVAVLEIVGDLTSSSDTVMDEAYLEAIQGYKKLLLCFREQDFTNSAGIALLIDLVSQSQQKDVVLRIAHPSAHFRKIFDLVGLSQHVSVFATIEEARQDF